MAYVIVAALGLFLIFEGILPFVAPKLWRRMVATIAQQSDRSLHITGLICMLIGLFLLFVVLIYIALILWRNRNSKHNVHLCS